MIDTAYCDVADETQTKLSPDIEFYECESISTDQVGFYNFLCILSVYIYIQLTLCLPHCPLETERDHGNGIFSRAIKPRRQ
jgi:hypothetical protein